MNAPSALRGLPRLIAAGVVDLLFPPLCVACDDRLPDGGRRIPLCPPCRRSLPHAPKDALDERLARLGAEADVLQHRLALWTFDEGGVMQSLQHTLKYRDRPALGEILGEELGRLWRARHLPTPDAVVPIPLARARLLERGYNQAERLAAGLAASLDSAVAEVLVRARSTRSQTRLSREERRVNVHGAFALADGANVEGKRLAVVDDVLTTGATLLAAAAALNEAGATVDFAVLALTRE